MTALVLVCILCDFLGQIVANVVGMLGGPDLHAAPGLPWWGHVLGVLVLGVILFIVAIACAGVSRCR